MAQTYWGTLPDRYPEMYRAARARIADTLGPEMGGSGLRILSFACSTGLEMVTLRQLFPAAKIVGCDIDLSLSENTPDLPGDIFFSTADAIAERGPYDLIMANSVFCTKDCANFRFSEFAELVSSLDRCLVPGGLLCIYNSSYRFTELPFAEEYRPVRCNLLVENGFMPKWTADGRRLSKRRKKWGLDRQEIIRPDLATLWDFRDCIFEKSVGGPVQVDLSGVEIPPGKARIAPAVIPLWRSLFTRVAYPGGPRHLVPIRDETHGGYPLVES